MVPGTTVVTVRKEGKKGMKGRRKRSYWKFFYFLFFYKVGFIREKGKATAREAQRSPEAGRSWKLLS
jgi:hypothetical protein